MSVLQLKDYGVAAARRAHPSLAGKAALARGTFSAVFNGSNFDTVLKLTVDSSSYSYLTDGLAPEGIFVPRVYRDYGEIGETSTGETIYLVELERLEPLKGPCPDATSMRRVIRLFHQHVCSGRDARNDTFPDSVWALPCMSKSLRSYLEQLETFAQNFQCAIDCKLGNNQMRRPVYGDLVMSDPVFDRNLLQRYRRPAYLRPH